MASGWVRFQIPQRTLIQVGPNLNAISNGEGNAFSAWFYEERPSYLPDADTSFFVTNHSEVEISVEHRWFTNDGVKIGEDHVAVIPPYNMLVIWAGANVET